MSRLTSRAALVGLTVLALGMSALGPCLCLLRADACHQAAEAADACRQAAEAADAHACCETPTGVQAVADTCCEDALDLVLASTEVPELAPPVLQVSPTGPVPPATNTAPVVVVPHFPPLSLDRTTVLLI